MNLPPTARLDVNSWRQASWKVFVAHVGCHFSMGFSGDSRGLPNARGFAHRETQATHSTSDDVGKSEMPSNTRALKVGKSVYISVKRHKMAGNIIVGEDHNAIIRPAAQRMQDQRLPRNLISIQKNLPNSPRDGVLLGKDCNVGLAGVLDKDVVESWWIGRPPNDVWRSASCKRTTSHCRVPLKKRRKRSVTSR